MKQVKLMLGDNIESLKKLPDNSVDSIVSDPPYGLSFMNKKWDYDVPSVEFWKEVLRVLKPGGHVLSFGGTRTYHRMVVNIEDAGFEIRDQIQWIYASGFPKSHNIGKAVDKIQGNEREVVGSVIRHDFKDPQYIEQGSMMMTDNSDMIDLPVTKGSSTYEGWGTALKPANEPICVARKPLSEKTIALNVLKWGTGGINIDGCRVEGEYKGRKECEFEPHQEGRFPANIILECICDEVIKGEKGEVIEHNRTGGIWNEGSKEPVGRTYNDKGDTHTNPMCPCRLLDEQSGVTKTKANLNYKHNKTNSDSDVFQSRGTYTPREDKGGSSRFFYQAKVSKKERNMGLDHFEEKVIEGRDKGQDERNVAYKARPSSRANTHPTVKPVALMSYLCRLVTPQGGIVLDPFMGSGSTGIAAQLEGFKFCGMEMDEDYFKIAESRIENYEKYREFINRKK